MSPRNHALDPLFRMFEWVYSPADRLVCRIHCAVSKLIGRLSVRWLYFEYDEISNNYIIALPHHKDHPDVYEVGHTAGKLSAILGAIPLVLGLIPVGMLVLIAPALPDHWAIALAEIALIVGAGLFCAAAFIRLISLGVEMQASDIPMEEVDREAR